MLPIELVKNEIKTMSSREIAELCDKRHDHVCRDIEVLNKSYINMGLPKVGDTPYKHPQNGQTYNEYVLSKEQCLDLVTGYKHELRIRINRRWQELENQQPKIPQNYIEALEAHLQSEKEKEALAIENKALKPKAQALERITHAKGNTNIRNTAKTLGQGKRKL